MEIEPSLSRRTLLKSLAASAGSSLLAGGSLVGCAPKDKGDEWLLKPPQTRTLFQFDTLVTLTASCDETLMEQVVSRAAYLESLLSRTIEGSDIWRINHAKGASVAVAPETAELIDSALGYCAQSRGLFDITIGALSSLWDFNAGIKPDEDAIQAALPHVNYHAVEVDRQANAVTISDPEAMLDLGGIAKGYIADDLCRLLRQGECKSAAINLGGNTSVIGKKPDGSPWTIGIANPNDTQTLLASVEAVDASVITSGLYERSFAEEGRLYHHILDPRTGYPAQTDLVATSVLTSRGIDGDALSTTLFLMGGDAARSFAEGHDALEALLVRVDGQIETTSDAPFKVS